MGKHKLTKRELTRIKSACVNKTDKSMVEALLAGKTLLAWIENGPISRRMAHYRLKAIGEKIKLPCKLTARLIGRSSV